MGADNLYDYLHKFGLGSGTGVDLQGEAAPILRKKEFGVMSIWTRASFGQGVAVTGIQMLRAVSAIANGGLLPSPHVVTEISGDGWQEKINLPPPVRVISQKARK